MENSFILLVEDNPDDELLTLRAFKKINLKTKISVVHDGAEALDFIFGKGIYENRDINILPSLILLDLKLPKMNGFEVLKKIRLNEKTKHLPVIILTSSKEEEDIINSYKTGANSYIQKSVDFDTFVISLKQINQYWIQMNLSPQELI